MSDDKTLLSLIELALGGSLTIPEAIQQAYEYGVICGTMAGIKTALETFSKVPA